MAKIRVNGKNIMMLKMRNFIDRIFNYIQLIKKYKYTYNKIIMKINYNL